MGVPLRIVLDDAAAAIVPHAFEVNPNGNYDNVDKSYDRAVERVHLLEINPGFKDNQTENDHSNNVQYLFEGDFGLEIYFEHLKKTNPLYYAFYLDTKR